jgi:cytochrome c-type biogenesis protein CcmH
MTYFWIIAALFLGVALLFIVPPLLRRSPSDVPAKGLTVSIYRDQLAELDADLRVGTITPEQFDKGRQELEHRMLDEVPVAVVSQPKPGSDKHKRTTAIITSLALPLCAVALYLHLGHPDAISPPPISAAVANAENVTPEQMAMMVDRLAARLKDKPDDAKGWLMLAQSYKAFQRFPDAVEAYKRAMALVPNNPQLLADYADTLGAVNNGDLNGKPLELIQAALKLDPNHQNSLALAGTAAFNNKEYAAAIAYWQRLLKTLPSDSEDSRIVAKNITEAQTAAGGTLPPVAQAAPASATPASAASASATASATSVNANASITGTVSLSAALAAQASPTDTVFIFARAASGPKMPLAILRVQVKELPKTFSLDDSMAMAPTMKLSNFPEVVVSARVSKSGNATPQSGDLSGTIGPISSSSQQIKLQIDTVVP